MIALLPLLGKKAADLTLEDCQLVATTFKIDVHVTPELREAGLAILKGANIDKVADMIQNPESVQQLLSIFQKPVPVEPVKQVIRCPHCTLFFLD